MEKFKRVLIGIIAFFLVHLGWDHITGIMILDASMSFLGGFLIGHLAVNYNLNN